MSFKASYDTTTKIISTVIIMLFVVIAVDTKSVLAGGIMALVLAAAYAWSPAGYSISDGDVVIRRLIGDVRIPLNGIRGIRVATIDDLSASIRLFGSGGLFGYYGIFRNSKLGKSTWYVTDRSRALVLESISGTALLSPDNVEGFMAAIRRSVPNSPPGSVKPILSVPGGTGGSGWKTTAIVIALCALSAGIFLYRPGPPEYTLTRNSLAIHDRFYPVDLNAASINVGSIRVIDLDKDEDWRPILRTNGIGIAHYHSGWFGVSSGKVVRMYRADSTRLILLPAKDGGTAVLLEAKEPARLVAELQEKWQSRPEGAKKP